MILLSHALLITRLSTIINFIAFITEKPSIPAIGGLDVAPGSESGMTACLS